MNKYKTCTICKQTKLFSDFNKNAAAKSGLQTKCRLCEKVIRREYYLRNKTAEIARVSKWHKETIKGKINRIEMRKKSTYKVVYVPVANQSEKQLQQTRIKTTRHNNRRRASLKNAEKRFISSNELKKLLRQPCFYCNSSERITIDHIVPLSRGGRHSIGNLISACHKCNSVKSARFIMEFRLNKTRAGSLRRTRP
jgi:5-methylcytosine-specific restriction endonuclease McrA